MAPISKLIGSFVVRGLGDCPIDSHMTENGCSGFEESWPWNGAELESESDAEWSDPTITSQPNPTIVSQPEPIWNQPSAGVKSESDYRLAGVPVFVWIMLFTAIVAVACVAFFFFARYLYQQDQAIKAAKTDEEAAAAEPAPEPAPEEAPAEEEVKPVEEPAAEPAEEEPPAPEPELEKTPLLAQAEADMKALEATPSLPQLWWAYGNLTARIGSSMREKLHRIVAN